MPWDMKEARYFATFMSEFTAGRVEDVHAAFGRWPGWLGLDREGWVRPILEGQPEGVLDWKSRAGVADERDGPGFVQLETARDRAAFLIGYLLGMHTGDQL